MKNNERAAFAAVVGLVLAVGACATQMTNTWKDPDAARTPLSKVAVISMAQDADVRRLAEDQVARRLGSRVTASYKILDGVDLNDRPTVDARLTRAGFDGLLIIQLTNVAEHIVDDMPNATMRTYYD